MRARLFLLIVALASPVFAQQPSREVDEEDVSVQNFLQALEASITKADLNAFGALVSENADPDTGADLFEAMIPKGITRVVVKERDRTALQGTLPGEGFRLVIEFFVETSARGRIATWNIDIRRPRGDDLGPQPWHIVAADRLASIEGLHKLSLRPDRQYSARNLVIRAIDFELRLPAGDVFVSDTADGTTAMVLIGDGTMVFQPMPKEEKGQLKLFAGTESLDTPFTSAFVRMNPFEFDQRVGDGMLEEVPVDTRTFRRATSLFDEGVPKSFNLDLNDLSREVWSLLPGPGDFVAEVRTRRFDDLTYARSSNEAEDITLFQRARKRNISAYASEQKLASRGRFFDEDELVDYDVLDYDIDAAFYPERAWFDGRAKLKLRVKAAAIGVLTLRFADSLNVSSVASDEFGRLLYLRVKNQNSILVNLPSAVPRDATLSLTVAYSGRLDRQNNLDESIALQNRNSQPDEIVAVPPEQKWLFSNRSYWYPQNQVTDYASARVRLTVPSEFAVVASGIAEPGSPVAAPPAVLENSSRSVARATYSFSSPQPLRYLAFVVSRMARVDAATVALDIVPVKTTLDMAGTSTLQQQVTRLNSAVAIPPVGARNTVALTIDANRRQESRGRDSVSTAADILRLYASLTGDVPYDAVAIAMVEDDVPGGHAPGYFAMMNNPPPVTQVNWRNDPAAFSNFPEFFLAHELAHQWFGQAVGWKNYHEQWLSEGFTQYFAALYARERRGENAFRDVLRQFRKWALEDSDQGPIYLGYRLGHIKNETRVFRAIVYNKGAAVLHMLRRLIGDQAFFAGLKSFYGDNRFRKAGTDDLRKAMEAASGENLGRFFERWVYDSAIPRVRYSTAVDGQDLVVSVEQLGDVFDLPITFGVTYTDGKTAEFVVVATSTTTEARFPLTGTVRTVEANPDGAAIAVIDRKPNQ